MTFATWLIIAFAAGIVVLAIGSSDGAGYLAAALILFVLLVSAPIFLALTRTIAMLIEVRNLALDTTKVLNAQATVVEETAATLNGVSKLVGIHNTALIKQIPISEVENG